jgi:hypothetical protein
MHPELQRIQLFMASQQFEERSQRLEARVTALETELLQGKQMLLGVLQKQTP